MSFTRLQICSRTTVTYSVRKVAMNDQTYAVRTIERTKK
jgi:hypothetical protein